jgi:hypothetical protein
MLGKLKTTTAPPRGPERDPARVALGLAIEDHKERLHALDRAKAAVARANGLVADAERHSEAVKIALASARDGREARLRQAIQGDDVIEAAVSRREARFAEIDAADELEAARKVLVDCMAALADADEDVHRAQGRVESAVAPILAGEVDRLIAEAQAHQAALDGKHATLIWSRGVLPPGEQHQRINFALPPPTPPGVRGRDYRPPSAWVAAREALMVDADAPLPTE